MVESILSYFGQALLVTLIQLSLMLGPGLLLTLILNYETRLIQNLAINNMGRGWYLGLFGWLGTVVHELGHAIFCLIFGHKITEIKLFHPDPETGTLGYVKHSYNRTNIYQLAGNFFIGIGPVLLGTMIIFLLANRLLGINFSNTGNYFSSTYLQLKTWEAYIELLQNIWNYSGYLLSEIFSWQHLASWQIYVFIYLAFAIGSSITLSPPDMKAALGGFIVIVILLYIANLATIWMGNIISNFVFGISGYYALFYAIIFLILIVNIVAALLLLLPLSILRTNQSKAN